MAAEPRICVVLAKVTAGLEGQVTDPTVTGSEALRSRGHLDSWASVA